MPLCCPKEASHSPIRRIPQQQPCRPQHELPCRLPGHFNQVSSASRLPPFQSGFKRQQAPPISAACTSATMGMCVWPCLWLSAWLRGQVGGVRPLHCHCYCCLTRGLRSAPPLPLLPLPHKGSQVCNPHSHCYRCLTRGLRSAPSTVTAASRAAASSAGSDASAWVAMLRCGRGRGGGGGEGGGCGSTS
jgi:hypothetical protein